MCNGSPAPPDATGIVQTCLTDPYRSRLEEGETAFILACGTVAYPRASHLVICLNGVPVAGLHRSLP